MQRLEEALAEAAKLASQYSIPYFVCQGDSPAWETTGNLERAEGHYHVTSKQPVTPHFVVTYEHRVPSTLRGA